MVVDSFVSDLEYLGANAIAVCIEEFLGESGSQFENLKSYIRLAVVQHQRQQLLSTVAKANAALSALDAGATS